ncbi:MAG: glucosamine-6-phosphate deaminase [Rubripirellula sp.]
MSETSSPTIVVRSNASEASLATADIIASELSADPNIVLGLATGGTPVGVYRELVRMHRDDGLDFSNATSFNLDEYVGLAANHPQSFRHFMQEQLFDHINIDPSRTHVPDGLVADVPSHASDYEQSIREAGGIGLQLLGIGNNGHIAFNEPGSAADSRTREVDLTQNTIDANARFFESVSEVPRRAITMGIGTIRDAASIVLMATGDAKADAIQSAIEGPCDPQNPASLLQRHPRMTFVLDEAAARKLSR